MILVTPYPQLSQLFRYEEVDVEGNTRTRRLATGRKLEDGTTLNAAVTIFGTPVVERLGSPNRRMLFSHNWSEDEVRRIEDEVLPQIPGAPDSAYLTDAVPSDWRYPDPE